VRDVEIKKQLSHSFRSKDAEALMNCSALICACADTSKDEKYKDYEAILALSVENILLACHDFGLGAFYMTTYNHNQEHIADRENLIKTLKLPSHIRLIALIPVGYPDDSEIIPEKELRDVKEILHWDYW
jgi:nitroreductase